MKTIDYRNTLYCPKLENLKVGKDILNKEIMSAHPKLKIVYNQINPKNGLYNKKFRTMYNHKCAYCGVSQKILNSELFEIDHFINEASFGKDKVSAGKIENLVLACKKCNRNKSDFLIKKEYRDKLNPDNGSIARIFFRDEKYYIRISKEYENDPVISEFYKQLELDHQTRRLDYLLMSMKGLYEKIKNEPESKNLSDCIIKLLEKRNNF